MTAPVPAPDGAARGPGYSLAGGSSLAHLPGVEGEGRRLGASSSSCRARRPDPVLRALGRPARAARGLGRRRPSPATSRRAPSATSSRASTPLPRVPEWEQIAQKVAEDMEAAIRGRETVPAALRDARRATWTTSSRSDAGSWPARPSGAPRSKSDEPLTTADEPKARGLPHEARAAWMLLAPGPRWPSSSSSSCPIVAAFLLSLTDFDIYSLGDVAEHPRHRPAQLREPPRRPAAVEGDAQHGPLPLRRRPADDRRRRSSRPSSLHSKRRAGQGRLPHDLLRALRHDARRRRRGVPLPLPPAVRPHRPRPRLVGIPPIDWLGDPRWAMPAIILLAVWKNFGYATILLVAGLQAIPGIALRGGAHGRGRRRGSSSARSRCRCSRRRFSFSAS